MTEQIERSEGRSLFGLNPDGYDAVRPDYPGWIYERLTDAGALTEGTSTLEIGAGSGLATSGLLAHGADPLTLIEPDERFAPQLLSIAEGSNADCHLIHDSFEAAQLEHGSFDLVAAATAFHWVSQRAGLKKVRELLRPGRHLALWWNVFQQLDRPDPFHEATRALLAPLATSPSGYPQGIPFALDRAQREAALHDTGFLDVDYTESRWTLTLDTTEVGVLYEGFSQIQRLSVERRRQLLDALMNISDARFDGQVERNMTTCLYVAKAPKG